LCWKKWIRRDLDAFLLVPKTNKCGSGAWGRNSNYTWCAGGVTFATHSLEELPKRRLGGTPSTGWGKTDLENEQKKGENKKCDQAKQHGDWSGGFHQHKGQGWSSSKSAIIRTKETGYGGKRCMMFA